MKRVGFIALIGDANVGKSTFINSLVGVKCLAVSDKPQTTRENIKAIYNTEDSQLIFIDTPGFHRPRGDFGRLLIKDAKQALSDCDVVIYMVDISMKINYDLVDKLKKIDQPLFVILNKIDKLKSISEYEKRAEKYYNLFKELPKNHFASIVAKDKEVPHFLIEEVKSLLPMTEPYFPDDMLLDHPIEFVYQEFIKEKCMRLCYDEVPHAVHVKVIHVEEDDSDIDITADIIVEKESERAILVGKGGKMISKIRSYSENSIRGFTGKACSLSLFVKVTKNWREDRRKIIEFGYTE